MPAPRLTFSKLPVAEVCPPSLLMPRSRRTIKWAVGGKHLHQFLADVPVYGREEALLRTAIEHRSAFEAIDLSRLPACQPDRYAFEVAVAYDTETDSGRELGRNLDRDYPETKPSEIPGSADVVGLTDDAVIVYDYKSGWGDLKSAKEHLQLRGYMLAFARAYGRKRAYGALIRLRDEGSDPWFDRVEMDEMDLDATAYTIQSLVERLKRIDAELKAGTWAGDTHQGEHCARCESFDFCPAQQILARQVVRAGSPFDEVAPIAPNFCSAMDKVGEQLTLENAAQFLERLDAAELSIKRLREIVDTFARGTPIPLADGKAYGPRPWPTEKIDPEKAKPIMVERYGDQVVYDAAVETKTTLTKGNLETALRSYSRTRPGMKPTKELRELVEQLRDRGASSIKFSYPVGEHKPKPQEPQQPQQSNAAQAEG